MTRICDITGKKPAVANWVSHAANKSKRRQLPNLQTKTFLSDLLGRTVTLRVSANGLRTIDKHGGIDNFMLNVKKTSSFSTEALDLRKAILASAEAK